MLRLFSDAEDDTIKGYTLVAAEYSITVIADDGINQTSAKMMLTVNETVAAVLQEEVDSGSGGIGFALSLRAWLLWRRRS
ncbi:hypothetical protein [Ferrimonas lipolytica]|uniref:Uncharacterized protein n=1 Tax=Ferrimonas lipolytica TaxID=2724191 RepID=A0A6H1UHE4_9GAMM|nr:hypothetical protein [Ferrimonas lipolytica]QIZ77212.1 hypothetical protein HER31_10175 [Ferrimonas lipolytica]